MPARERRGNARALEVTLSGKDPKENRPVESRPHKGHTPIRIRQRNRWDDLSFSRARCFCSGGAVAENPGSSSPRLGIEELDPNFEHPPGAGRMGRVGKRIALQFLTPLCSDAADFRIPPGELTRDNRFPCSSSPGPFNGRQQKQRKFWPREDRNFDFSFFHWLA